MSNLVSAISIALAECSSRRERVSAVSGMFLPLGARFREEIYPDYVWIK